MMMYEENNKLPQVETPLQGQSTPGSDRVKAPVATGSGKDFEGRKSTKQDGQRVERRQRRKLPLYNGHHTGDATETNGTEGRTDGAVTAHTFDSDKNGTGKQGSEKHEHDGQKRNRDDSRGCGHGAAETHRRSSPETDDGQLKDGKENDGQRDTSTETKTGTDRSHSGVLPKKESDGGAGRGLDDGDKRTTRQDGQEERTRQNGHEHETPAGPGRTGPTKTGHGRPGQAGNRHDVHGHSTKNTDDS
ncbi:hypothetical protein PV326_010820 [Microctonus aethiopoides]|nr:hypothetical protein PV326_010820 [Microctonus aethiopoides]